jgi:sugar/nucleoside kinase (ribokinase family)
MDLICVGDVMLDVRVDAGELAKGGDVHGRVALRPGGTSANAAVWAVATGASARVHGRVGDDLVGRLLRNELAERGVDAVLADDGETPSGTMLVVVEAGERSMVADRGANARLVPSDLPATLEAGAVLVSGYLLFQAGTEEAGVEAIRRARGPWIAVDAASWPLVDAVGRDGFHERADGTTALLANDRETHALTGLDDPVAAARSLADRYRLVCVKRGAAGALLILDGTEREAPAESIVELDPTGAGDAFDGVLLSSLARGVAADEALRLACHAGARVAASDSTWPEPER